MKTYFLIEILFILGQNPAPGFWNSPKKFSFPPDLFQNILTAREAREARAREARWKTQNKGAEKNDQKMTKKWPTGP